MRKITFDSDTIEAIRTYISEGHSIEKTQNRFNLKYDTLRRVMHENGIEAYYQTKKSNFRKISQDDIDYIIQMFANTQISMQDLVKSTKLEYYIVKEIIDAHFDKEFQDRRKSKLYSESKLGDKNPMKKLTGSRHPSYKGVVADGNGYLMVKRPDWYTGRLGKYYVFQHTVVMCEYLGITELPKGMVIHHIDRNRKNNDISNLMLMTASAHTRLHALERNLCKVQRLSNKE